MVKLYIARKADPAAIAYLITHKENPDYKPLGLDKKQAVIASRLRDMKKPLVSFFTDNTTRIAQFLDKKTDAYQAYEQARRAGAALASEIRGHKINDIVLITDSEDPDLLLAYAEGLVLGAYSFEKYKKEKQAGPLASVGLAHPQIKQSDIAELGNLIEAVILARDIVNEPANHLGAEKLAECARESGKKAGYKTEILNKNKIEALRMGGLLAVNAGSVDPPSFSILEWKPKNARNKQPVVLIGKGVVYDTGGLTIKPTPGGMDTMKSDMAGAAAVIGAIYAAATNKLPLYIVGLIPATDNRPGERAMAPGDVLTMYDGTTVEMLNADAEGRLILADALAYAKKYKPQLVLDLATLTGAAARAIGHLGIVYMGTAGQKLKSALEKSGHETHERLVEFPFWDEYAEMLKSDIADLKNVSGGTSAGAITAGKFLQHFTDYPWLHLDIAGPAFLTSADSYRSKGATGVGVRLLYNYLKSLAA